MNTDDKNLLENFGFEERDGFWIFRKRPDNEEANEAVVVVTVTDGGKFKGEFPFVSDAVVTERVDSIPQNSLPFVSANVKDMLALAQNEIGNSIIQSGDYIDDDDLSIDFEGIAYVAPFCSDPWGDYQLVNETGLLTDPASIFGPLYEEWRERVVSMANNRAPAL